MKAAAAWAIALILFNPLSRYAAVDSDGALLGQSLRLDHPSVGCETPDALMRIAILQVGQGDAAMLNRLSAEDCRMFTSFHGEVTDAQGDMLCVLGLGNSRCLWFVRTAFVLARPL